MTQFKSYSSKISSPPMLRGYRILLTQCQLPNSALEAVQADQGSPKWRDA